MYDNFFIHSSVNGYLGCFQVLAIVNSASVSSGAHVSFQLWFPECMNKQPNQKVGRSKQTFLKKIHNMANKHIK